MCKLDIQCMHNWGSSISLKIDGDFVEIKSGKLLSQTQVLLSQGVHEIAIAKKSFINTWYWWINIFNMLYVLLRIKNRTGGLLGFDDKYAAITILLKIKEHNDACLNIKLSEKSYNKNGWNGSYLTWQNITISHAAIISIHDDKMPKYLVSRWRIVHGISTPFYCLLTYIFFIIEICVDNLTINLSIGVYVVLSLTWALYIAISSFIAKDIEANIGISRRIIE